MGCLVETSLGRLLLRAVRILLECILVSGYFALSGTVAIEAVNEFAFSTVRRSFTKRTMITWQRMGWRVSN